MKDWNARKAAKMAPFWRFFGGKFRATPRYPYPQKDTIVEPFAGAAGYSTRYADRNVILVERDPVIAELWRFLIGASAADIRAIPCVEAVADLPGCTPEGARILVGFSLNDGVTRPCNTLSAGRKKSAASGRKFEGWNEAKRNRIAAQVELINHWHILEGDYSSAPEIDATWFIDPPYIGGRGMGRCYRHGTTGIDYTALGAWCQARNGQVLVCEASGAEWLPFRDFGLVKAGPARKTSSEVIWSNEHATDEEQE